MTSDFPSPWIYLNGYPGVGKLSIARELTKLIPGARVIDNHLLIDISRGVFEMASEEYEYLRQAIRSEVLTAITSTSIGQKTTYIFTGSHVKENPVSPLVARDYENRAKASNVPFVSVILACEEAEHLRRATSPSRQPRQGAPGKLTDVKSLKAIRSLEIFKFQCEHELAELDITKLTASEAAERVKRFVDDSIP